MRGSSCTQCAGYLLLGQLLAPMTQVSGLTSGWLIDPTTLSPLINTEAGVEALRLLQALASYSWPRYDLVCIILFIHVIILCSYHVWAWCMPIKQPARAQSLSRVDSNATKNGHMCVSAKGMMCACAQLRRPSDVQPEVCSGRLVGRRGVVRGFRVVGT